MTCHMGS